MYSSYIICECNLMTITSRMENVLRQPCCPHLPLSSVCNIQLLVRNSAQNFINVRENGERERERERERELLADCGINFHATNYGNKTVSRVAHVLSGYSPSSSSSSCSSPYSSLSLCGHRPQNYKMSLMGS